MMNGKKRLICLFIALCMTACALAACSGDRPETPWDAQTLPTDTNGQKTPDDLPGTGTGTNAGTDVDTDDGAEPRVTYEDIGEGRFMLDNQSGVFYATVGRPFCITGRYDFDAPVPERLTVTADDPDAIEVSEDGTVTVKKPGDYTLTVREERYGTAVTAKLTAVGNPTDNILISVPVWRGKWVNEEQFGYMRDAEVDMVVAVSGVENKTWDVSLNMLDVALQTWRDGRGVFVLAHSTDDMLGNVLTARDRDLQKTVSRFVDKPAFAGYHIIDEPYDANPYAPVQNRLGELDPYALTDINFLPGGAYPDMTEYEHRLDDYCRLLDDSANTYLSFDNYPFGAEAGAVNEGQLFGNFEAVRRAGLSNRVRTAFYLQAVGGFNNAYRRPDAATLTYHTASALAYGFKWIKYWSWFVPDYGDQPAKTYRDYTDAIIGKDGKPTDLYETACDLHHRVHTIGPILVNCEAVEVYHTGNRSTSNVYTRIPADFFVKPVGRPYAIVSLLEDRTDGCQYLMFVNKDMTKAQDMSFTLDGVTQVTVVDTRTGAGTPQNLKDGMLTLHLEAGDFAFVILPQGDTRFGTVTEEPDNLVLSSRVKMTVDRSSGHDGCYAVCATDGRRVSDRDAYAWRVPAGETGCMTFSFDSDVTLNRIDLYPAGEEYNFGATFPKSVHISVLVDGEWREVYGNDSVQRPKTEVPVIRFDSVTTRQIKITVANGVLVSDIAEIEMYCDGGSVPMPGATTYKDVMQEKGENVALHKTPIASGSAYENVPDGWGLSYLTDGSVLRSLPGGTNGWMAQGVSSLTPKAGTVWGGVDLGADYRIDRIVIYPRESGQFFPSAYDVQISGDGENWETVFSEDNDTITDGTCRTFSLPETRTARFVRITARKLRSSNEPALGGYLMQVAEIEVYMD